VTLQMKQDTGGTVTLQAATSGTATATVPAIAGVVSVEFKGADIASATTTDLSTATGDFVDVTGTTTITGLGTLAAGIERTVRFTGILTLTHNATSLILPGAANITTAANDRAVFRSLGSGNWLCVSYNKASGAAVVSSGGGLTNWSESAGTYSSKDWKRFYPVSGTNVNAVFSPLGTGSLQAHVADGTSTGGNQRGSNSIDWQTSRSSASMVASGAKSVIGGGANNIASGIYSSVSGGVSNTASGVDATVCGGYQNTASASYSTVSGGYHNTASVSGSTVAGGYTNTANGAYATISGGKLNSASGIRSTVCGGSDNTADGQYSTILGGTRAVARGAYGGMSYASGRFSTNGDAQWRMFVQRKSSTSATPVVLTSDAGAASTTNQIILPNNSCYMIRGLSACLRTDVAGDRAEYEWSCGIYRGANAASTVVDYSNVDVRYEGDATFDFTLAADTTNGGLTISFVGASGKTVRAVTTAWCCEVTA